MFVNFFTVKIYHANPVKISHLSKAFGDNIPNYTQLEGGRNDGIVIQFCVAATVDVADVCKKHIVELHTLYISEIDDEHYNELYTVFGNVVRKKIIFNEDI